MDVQKLWDHSFSYQKGVYGPYGGSSNSHNNNNGYKDSYKNYDDGYERQGGYYDYDYDRDGYGGCSYGGGGYQEPEDIGIVLALLVGGALITYILYQAITTNLAAAGGARKTWTFNNDIFNNILNGKIKQPDHLFSGSVPKPFIFPLRYIHEWSKDELDKAEPSFKCKFFSWYERIWILSQRREMDLPISRNIQLSIHGTSLTI